MAERDDDTPFLRRWSERKRQAAEPEAPAEEAGADQAVAEDAQEAPPEMSEEEIDAKLAEIDQMKQGDDFKPLIQASMPEVIRRAALRKLWRSNPIIGFRDGLNDYDLDYTNAATVVENLKSAYRAGKGYLTDEKQTSEAKKAPESSEAEPAEAAPSSEVDESDDEAGAAASADSAAPDLSEAETQTENLGSQDPFDGRQAESDGQSEKEQEKEGFTPKRAALKRWERFRSG